LVRFVERPSAIAAADLIHSCNRTGALRDAPNWTRLAIGLEGHSELTLYFTVNHAKYGKNGKSGFPVLFA
jgi:hypothetical protein